MIYSRTEILSTLKKLKKEVKNRYKVKNLGLFGSYVNEEQKETSDIDILAEFEEEADLFHYIGLSLFLEEYFKKKVDIVSKAAIKEEFRKDILKEAIYA